MNNQLIRRRQEIFKNLVDNSIAILHSGYAPFRTADECYEYVVNNNFYYLSNIDQEDSILVIGKSNNEYFEKLFITQPTEFHEKWLGHQLTLQEASELSSIEVKDIGYTTNFESYVESLLQNARYTLLKIQNVYLDLERFDVPLYNTFALNYAKKLKNKYPAVRIYDVYDAVIELRMVKCEEEVELMKQSIETTNHAIQEVMRHHNELKNESYAEAYYNFINTKEQKPLSFTSIIAGGKNATTLHYHANNSELKGNELLLMDVGCYTKHYASDISRTFPVNGKFSPKQKEVYEVVLDCNKRCIDYARPGISWKQLNDYANDILAEGLIKLGLIKEKNDFRKYYFHSIGHSVGLDVHDPGIRNKGLLEGMVITIEPGLYIPEWEIGVRIEDNILLTKEKTIVLSKNIIKEVADIEDFLSKNK